MDESSYNVQLSEKQAKKIDATVARSPSCVKMVKELRAAAGGREALFEKVGHMHAQACT